MFRNQIRRGIRAVRAGDHPAGVCRNSGRAVPTYCNDTIVRVPPAETLALDKQMMRETGRKLAEGYLTDPPLMTGR
jgi:hypothetical protein